MNICVVGAGAIGGWVAARLALAGERVRAAQLSSFQGAADILIVAVKATSLTAAARSARTLAGPDTIIVPMLNGVPWWFVGNMRLNSVDPDGSIAEALPFEQILGCVDLVPTDDPMRDPLLRVQLFERAPVLSTE